MMTLWGSLLVMSVLAAVFVLWPWWRYRGQQLAQASEAMDRQQANIALYRQHLAELEAGRDNESLDEAQFAQLKHELERSLLADSDGTSTGISVAAAPAAAAGNASRSWVWLLVLAVVLPLGAGVVYWQRGASQDFQIQQLALQKRFNEMEDMRAGRAWNPEATETLKAKLEARLEYRPDNEQNWFLLAHTAMELQDYLTAVKAYQQVLKIDPTSGRVMAELAQAMFLANGNRMTSEVSALTARALEAMPNNSTALGLAGVAAFEVTDYGKAIEFWTRALQVMGVQGAGAEALMAGISRAKSQLALSSGDTGAVRGDQASGAKEKAGGAEEKAGRAVKLVVQVSLDAEVVVAPDQFVYVYARAWRGPKMPLAIQRFQVSELPREVVLDESMAMAPGMNIGSFPQLELVARISQDGSPSAKPGDWQGSLGPLELEDLPEELALNIAVQLP